MPILPWIGKNKVVNHYLDVPHRVLNHKCRFTAEGAGGLPYLWQSEESLG